MRHDQAQPLFLPDLDANLLIEVSDPSHLRPEGPSVAFWRPRLAHALGVPEAQLRFEAITGLAPAAWLRDERFWVSFSRTSGARVCAWSRSTAIGVDIESTQALPELDQLCSIALASDEASRLHAAPAENRVDTFLSLWVRKEAVLKAAGLGLRADPRSVLTRDDRTRSRAMLASRRYDTVQFWLGQHAIAAAVPARAPACGSRRAPSDTNPVVLQEGPLRPSGGGHAESPRTRPIRRRPARPASGAG